MRNLILKLIVLAALALVACADAELEDATYSSSDAAQSPPSGPRFFEGGDKEFFGPDSPIVTIRPELGYRPDLRLRDNVYWLDDDVAKRRVFVDQSTVEVQVDGPDDMALQYTEGMVLINKYYPMRHRIVRVERRDGRVIWTVAQAGYDEVILEGEIYLKVPEGVATPVGLDVLDPWLYDSREAQLEDIYENYLDSELIQMMASSDSIETVRQRLQGQQQTIKQEMNLLPRPEWCDSISEDSLPCSELYEAGSDALTACEERKKPCSDVYEEESARDACEKARSEGAFDIPELILCDAYVRNNIDQLRVVGDPGDSPANWDHDACIENGTTLQCNKGVYERLGDCLPILTDLGNDEDRDGESEPYEVCPIFRPNATIDSAVEVLCEGMCRFDEEDRSAAGGASEDDWSAGVGVCINSEAFGDDKCRASVALRVNGSFDVVEALGGSDDTEGVQDAISLTLTPVFTSAVGFEADMSIRPFWVGIKIGFFAGIGIGNRTTLAIKESGARWTTDVDILDEIGVEPEIPLPPILFLTFFLRPSVEAHFFAEANVVGEISHNYFQEKSFAICLAGRAGGGPGFGDWPESDVYVGQKAIDECGLEVSLESDNLNEIETDDSTALEIRAGVEIHFGISLVLKIAGELETGSITYYPFIPRFSIGVTLRPPRCSVDIVIAFGWRFSAELEIGISKFSIPIAETSESGTYESPRYYESFPIDFFEGCGVIEPPDPAVYEGLTCPPGPDPEDPDGNCASLPEHAGSDARCFVDRCVAQDETRVSLAWYNPDVDLDLYVRSPDGTVYAGDDLNVTSCGATCGSACSSETDCLDGWRCESDRCVPEDPTYIENFASPAGDDGTWEAWVVLRDGPSAEESVLYDLEFERAGEDGPRRSTRGSLTTTGENSSLVYVFCPGEECQ